MDKEGRTQPQWPGLCVALLLAACGGNGSSDHAAAPPPAPASTPLACDDGIAAAFMPDAATRVLLVKAFKAGDPIALASTPATPAPPTAPIDVCLVKLLVGPGNPGPAGAPSTTAGIGIEVWLPAATNWNGVIRAFGSAGWAGGGHTDPAAVGTRLVYLSSLAKGYAISHSDTGHTVGTGAFAMNPDGSINRTGWQDFAERGGLEQVRKTKALVRAYYARAHDFAYWDGFSNGGRQGYKLAQRHAAELDGVLIGAPPIDFTPASIGTLYPQLVMQRELGGLIPAPKLAATSGAAVRACDVHGLGFLVDPLQCRYDPTRDAQRLCAGVAGNGVTGTGAGASCLTLAEARAINAFWYGPTALGGAPDPQADNGGSASLGSGDQLWFGLARGTNLLAVAGAQPFPVGPDYVALALQDARYAGPSFVNAAGNGSERWRTLDYAGLAAAIAQGRALQSAFGDVDTADIDLRGARDRGLKVLAYHGLADLLLPPQGTIQYHARVGAALGGIDQARRFHRLVLIPGLAHDVTLAGTGSIDADTGAPISANRVPLPQSWSGRDELFVALRDWVERGAAPERIDVRSADGSVQMPLCVYPQKAVYAGNGPVQASASWSCR